MNTMKSTNAGTVCAMTKGQYNSNGAGEGIGVGQYFKAPDSVAMFMCSYEYDDTLMKNKVIIHADNCKTYDIPVVIASGSGENLVEKPVNLSGKIFVLIECVERYINTLKYATLQEAQQAMLEAYVSSATGTPFNESEYAGKTFADCLALIAKSEHVQEGRADFTEFGAYLNDGPNHDMYDWVIEEISV